MFGYLPSSTRQLAFERLLDEDHPELEADPSRWAEESKDGPAYFKWAARHTSGRTFVAESCVRCLEVDGEELLFCVIRDLSFRESQAEPENSAAEGTRNEPENSAADGDDEESEESAR